MIRHATTDDIASLRRLTHISYSRLLAPHYPRHVLTAALPAMSHVDADFLACVDFYVFEMPNGLLGCAGWSRDNHAGQIRKVAIHPDHTRHGIGSKLMEQVHRAATAAGETTLNCTASHPAVPFYRRLGYRDIGPIDIDTGTQGVTFTAIKMTRTL